MATMINLVTYESKDLNTGKITPEKLFESSYIEEIHESEQVRTYTNLLRVILDAKYKKSDLNRVTENQRQNLKEVQPNEYLKLLQKFEELFNGTLGTWKIDSLYFRSKDHENTICSRPYSVPKVHK